MVRLTIAQVMKLIAYAAVAFALCAAFARVLPGDARATYSGALIVSLGSIAIPFAWACLARVINRRGPRRDLAVVGFALAGHTSLLLQSTLAVCVAIGWTSGPFRLGALLIYLAFAAIEWVLVRRLLVVLRTFRSLLPRADVKRRPSRANAAATTPTRVSHAYFQESPFGNERAIFRLTIAHMMKLYVYAAVAFACCVVCARTLPIGEPFFLYALLMIGLLSILIPLAWTFLALVLNRHDATRGLVIIACLCATNTSILVQTTFWFIVAPSTNSGKFYPAAFLMTLGLLVVEWFLLKSLSARIDCVALESHLPDRTRSILRLAGLLAGLTVFGTVWLIVLGASLQAHLSNSRSLWTPLFVVPALIVAACIVVGWILARRMQRSWGGASATGATL